MISKKNKIEGYSPLVNKDPTMSKPATRKELVELIADVKEPIHPTEAFQLIVGMETCTVL